jgi:hypothetical protein
MMTEGVGSYGIDYLRRATVAMMGLGANQPGDAVYPALMGDADGAKLVAPNRCAVGGGGSPGGVSWGRAVAWLRGG